MEKFSKAVIRTSAYPFEFIQKLLEKPTEEVVKILMGDPFFVRALNLASPELLREVERIETFNDQSKNKDKLIQSLIKYAARISTRSTPFGLFSGINTIHLDVSKSEGVPILINDPESFTGTFRLDMNFSALYASLLSKTDIIRRNTKFYPNTTLYCIGSHYRLIYYSTSEMRRNYELISVEKNEILSEILTMSSLGVTFGFLINELVSQGFDKDNAEEYITDLIDSQLLISELEPSTLGKEVEFQLLNKLEEIIFTNPKDADKAFITINIDYLKNIIDKLDALNQKESLPGDYNALIDFIKTEIPLQIDKSQLDVKHIIQCVMSIDIGESEVSMSQQKLIDKGIHIINHFKPKGIKQESARIKNFKENFSKRYDGKMVPLVEALDVETGIGYGQKTQSSQVDVAPLLKKINLGHNYAETENVSWNKQTNPFWLSKMKNANKNGDFQIEITNEDLKQFNTNDVEYSTTYAAKVSLFKKADEDVILFSHYSQGTASTWFGRFCNGNSSVGDLTQEIANYEKDQRPNAIVAEINHLPESRLGNIIQRPDLREYKINYLAGYTNKSDPKSISIEDLMVGMEGHRIILVSKKNNKEIIPYHSNAFNINQPSNLPIFQFLADLENLNNPGGFSLNLESFHRYVSFIPRVHYQNIILQRASWKIQKVELRKMKDLEDVQLMQSFNEFANLNLFPRYLLLKEGDNELLIDTENLDSIKILLNQAKGPGQLNLVEFMLNEFESAVKNKKGEQFNNELLVSYKMEQPKKVSQSDYSKALKSQVPDRFSPGSEWVYFKVYLGVKMSDKLLIQLDDILKEFKTTDIIDKWFFIRYIDQGEHLRIRFKVKNCSSVGSVMTKMNHFFESFNQTHKISNVTLDTYQRELSRYGYEEIDNFEKLFQYDSEMCIQLIDLFNENGNADKLWLAAMYSMNTYCDLFNLSLDQKIEFTKNLTNAFRNEFKANSHTTKSLNAKFNSNKGLINSFFIGGNKTDFFSFAEIIDKRNQLCKPIIDGIIDRNTEESFNFLSSLIHMNVNRLFRSNQRMYEFVSYDFLQRINTTMKYVKQKV